MKIINLLLLIILSIYPARAQLKFLLEDFEGFADGPSGIKENGVFTYGYINATVDSKVYLRAQNYSGQRALKILRDSKFNYGGWGKGIGLNIQLDQKQDYFNFYSYFPLTVPLAKSSNVIRIELQEDDNGDNIYQKEKDDSWSYTLTIENVSNAKTKENLWELISIPLMQFTDDNPGGDGVFNINYKQGKLLSYIISFPGENNFREKQECYFDFICFSKGKLPTAPGLFDAPPALKTDFCSLGTSTEGIKNNHTTAGGVFEANFSPLPGKKLGVVHFFQPFGKDDGKKTNHYPSIERLNKVIAEGYIPMITLENHFIIADPNMKQPNLYSITEGHFDSFFGYWASQIKQVKGTVMLRMLHEFNGDWYPWCIVKNDKNPQLVGKTFRYIHNIFKQNNVTNVKFIWCPNSMSIPQESWNYIMDAYPGNEYVDYVGLDIYNGAGKSVLWKSFRKEGIENYFILTQQLPDKPLLICETASREQKAGEAATSQSKAEWIKQMSEALKTDMSKIRLITWFNEKETFNISSSKEANKAYLNYVMKDDHFKSGPEYIFPKAVK